MFLLDLLGKVPVRVEPGTLSCCWVWVHLLLCLIGGSLATRSIATCSSGLLFCQLHCAGWQLRAWQDHFDIFSCFAPCLALLQPLCVQRLGCLCESGMFGSRTCTALWWPGGRAKSYPCRHKLLQLWCDYRSGFIWLWHICLLILSRCGFQGFWMWVCVHEHNSNLQCLCAMCACTMWKKLYRINMNKLIRIFMKNAAGGTAGASDQWRQPHSPSSFLGSAFFSVCLLRAGACVWNIWTHVKLLAICRRRWVVSDQLRCSSYLSCVHVPAAFSVWIIYFLLIIFLSDPSRS
jgi:hypothetical protein